MGLLRHLVKLLIPLNSLILVLIYGKHQKKKKTNKPSFFQFCKAQLNSSPKDIRMYEKITNFKVNLQGSCYRTVNITITLSKLLVFFRTGLGSILVTYDLGLVTQHRADWNRNLKEACETPLPDQTPKILKWLATWWWQSPEKRNLCRK